MSTKEPQYRCCLDLRDRKGLASLGLMTNQVWHDDPRRLGIVLARYKFVAKMYSGMKSVLEVGCADAFGARVVRQEVSDVTATDFDPVFIEDARNRQDDKWPLRLEVHDFLSSPLKRDFDGAYALDVLEHIHRADEDRFVGNIAASLNAAGALILGSPSLPSQAYASPPSKEGHINCKDHGELKELCQRFFHRVFLFSMNDEVVHTGFYPMAHYLIALCTHRK